MAQLYSVCCWGRSHPSPALLHCSGDAHEALTLSHALKGKGWGLKKKRKNECFTRTVWEQVFTTTLWVSALFLTRQPAICGLFNIEKVQLYCLGIVPRVGLALFINMFPHDFLGHEWLIWCDDGENYLVGLIICPSWIPPPFFPPVFLPVALHRWLHIQ